MGSDAGLGPPSGECLPPSGSQALRRCVWDSPQVSTSPEPLGAQPPTPDGPSSCPCPCPFQISCQPAGAAASLRGRASHTQDALQRAKSSEVERGHLFLDLTVLFRELILHFLESVFLLPLDFEILKNYLTLRPFLSFGSGPQNHTPKFCAKLTPCLPNRPALTPRPPTVPNAALGCRPPAGQG